MSPLSRRGLLGGVAAAGAAGGFGVARATGASVAGEDVIAFHATHQAGVVTPPQARLHAVALDVLTEDRAALADLLRRWTAAAEVLTRGRPVGPGGAVDGDAALPPDDTGEALGLGASRLTITLGLGPGLFVDAQGRDRFGIAGRRPAALAELPHFPGDALDPRRSGGDLLLQVCADDPLVAVHAVRNLVRIGFGTAAVRWSQTGFGGASSGPGAAPASTPRNLFGFKDGTATIAADDRDALRRHVWVGPGDDAGADWLAGGTFLVARRIAMRIETWDRQPLGDQERFIGRTKAEGAPLSGGGEHTAPDFARRGPGGPVIPVDAHVRVVHPSQHGGARMLRRGYNFVDGSDSAGAMDAGLFFVAFVRDPRAQFIPVQRAMSRSDALMEYLSVTGSALFAVPPGVAAGEYWGQALFG